MKNPELVDGELQQFGSEADTLFITCASYEERCLQSVRRLSETYSAANALICVATEYKEAGRASEFAEEIVDQLRARSRCEPILVPFPIDAPLSFLASIDSIVARICNHVMSSMITIDISTFPRLELLVLLKYLDEHAKRGGIRLLYSEPEGYATEESAPDDQWLTRGVRSVQSVPGFCGIQYPNRSKLLVAILGHEGERTSITLRRHQPDRVIFLTQGPKQYRPSLREISLKENRNIISQFGENSLWPTSLPARGVRETFEELSRIFLDQRYSHNLFVAANGTKLQLVGAFYAARKYAEIQMTYASPAVYNWPNYSKGIGPLWQFPLQPREQRDSRS